jgi:DNA-binding NarL/FixJ family response regulator
MRVLVADDHAAVRSALRRLLKEQPGFHVVGEVVSGTELLDQVAATQPDLVLLNWELRGLSHTSHLTAGRVRRSLLNALHSLRSHPKVIALSSRPELRHAALNAGADAFVSKRDPPERLLRTLRTLNSHFNDGNNVAQDAQTSTVNSPRDCDAIGSFQIETEEAI